MRLDHQDIAKWQVHKAPVIVPEAPQSIQDTGKPAAGANVSVDITKYNLCTRNSDTVGRKPLSV